MTYSVPDSDLMHVNFSHRLDVCNLTWPWYNYNSFQIKVLMFCTFLWDDEKIMGVDENIGNTVLV